PLHHEEAGHWTFDDYSLFNTGLGTNTLATSESGDGIVLETLERDSPVLQCQTTNCLIIDNTNMPCLKDKEKKADKVDKEIPPFRLCLENLLRNLQRKDVYNIFQFPVSDAVAPGYSKVIKKPMDFMTMSQKIEKDEYTSIEEFLA
uniref:Bromo domain-containing protein n=1 Tax=Clytia hemisphaerica TaxID=252671 RepID=A0A7M5WX99_9CNID